MIVLSHRGLWKQPNEKNTEISFRRSFESNFGTETDIRDYCGELVISHDIADSACMPLSEFFQIYNSYSKQLPLGLNIKADGLQEKLILELKKFNIKNYFVFDMSVPDGLVYIKAGLNTFTRQSEYELNPAFYGPSKGVWLDEFSAHWINEMTVTGHLNNGKDICIVSPELHKRPIQFEWDNYKKFSKKNKSLSKIMICTDFPEEAERKFNED